MCACWGREGEGGGVGDALRARGERESMLLARIGVMERKGCR